MKTAPSTKPRPIVREVYVALLRGINVGGHNIIPMAALAMSFERLRFAAVKTYIQSGNVIFATPKADPRKLEVTLEKALTKEFGYDATVVVRSRPEMQDIVRSMPKAWAQPDPAKRYNVVFLRHTVDSRAILDGFADKVGIEDAMYRPGVVYWSGPTSDHVRTALGKLASSRIGKDITTRNLNTTQKLAALMAAVE